MSYRKTAIGQAGAGRQTDSWFAASRQKAENSAAPTVRSRTCGGNPSSSAATLHGVAGIPLRHPAASAGFRSGGTVQRGGQHVTASKPAYLVNGDDIQLDDASKQGLLSRDKPCDINAQDDIQKSSNQ
ncbi:MAG: hypothetical protein M3436_14820 [Pseudomonadota bacterium]|nr:hypothetical protein [Pseudomonadota bacterium]